MRELDLKQLTALVTVAEVGSVTGAARLLHVVQPAVTRQIRMLEAEIGVPLFDRTPSGMVPTPAGEALVERARRALQELERARAEIRPDPDEVAGIVTVGMLESVIDVLMEPLVEAVGERYPGIQLRILTAYSGHLQQWPGEGDVDLSLLYDSADSTALSVIPMLRESLWAVAPADAGLTPEEPISWTAALQHPMVMPIAGHGLRALIDQARAGGIAAPRVAVETNSMYMQKKLVLKGHGWTVLPAAGVAREIASGRLSGAPLCRPEVARSVVLVQPRGTRSPASVRAVAAELTQLVATLVDCGEWPSAQLADGMPEPHPRITN